MALTSATKLLQRSGSEFGNSVAAGEKVFRGGLIALNAAGNIVRVQTSGAVVFFGVSDRDLDNTASAAVSDTKVVGLHGTFQIAVPSATPSNIGAPVYATDDNTLTLTQAGSAPFLLQVGTLAGIEGGKTWLRTTGTGT